MTVYIYFFTLLLKVESKLKSTMVLSKLGIVLDLISLTGCEINSNSRMKMMWTEEKQILNEDIFTTVVIAI